MSDSTVPADTSTNPTPPIIGYSQSEQPAQPVQAPIAPMPTELPPVQAPTPPPIDPIAPVTPVENLEKPPKSSILTIIKNKLPLIGLILLVVLVLFGVSLLAFRLFAKKTPEKVTLTYWGLFEDKQAMDGIIQDFQRENPTITVNYIKKDIEDYRESVVTQVSAGNGPDIFRFHNSWTGMMKNYLTPLSQTAISPDEFKKNYYPVVQKDMVRNGALYGIPLGIDTMALFINTELFQASGYSVPQTWDQFVQVSKQLTVKDQSGAIKTAGAALGTYDNINHSADILAMLMAQNGANFSSFSSTMNQEAQALEFYKSFATDQDSVWNSSQESSMTAFAKGKLAMYFGYSWDIFSIKAMNPDLNFTTNPVPNLPSQKVGIASYWAEGVSSKSTHQKEAMLFISYLTKKETLQKLYESESKERLFGEIYPRSDMKDLLLSNPILAPFVAQADYVTSSYFSSNTHDKGINEQMNAYLGNAVRGTDSAQSAIETLAQGVAQVLSKYGQ